MTSRINFNGNGNGMGDNEVLNDMKRQAQAAQDKRLHPASATEFTAWASDSLRKSYEQYLELQKEHQGLSRGEDQAQIGLDRLRTLVNYKNQMDLEHLQDMQRDFVHANRGIGYVLERCKKILDETATSNVLIANTLSDPLADNRKKIAVQKELGLRLRDVDDQFERCRRSVNSQKKKVKVITEGIQKLMAESGLKLPPSVKENIKKEDTIRRIALDYGKVLSKAGQPTPVPEETSPPILQVSSTQSNGALQGLGSETEKTGLDPKLAAAVAVAGITLGLVIFFVPGKLL